MIQKSPLWQLYDAKCREARAPRVRSIRQFAEEEITIPEGPFRDRKFRCHRQPYSRLWFDTIADPWWVECVITGPSQSGKTLVGFVIPLLYHLFELQQTVIAAVPSYEMVRDKWEQDIEPALMKTRYAELVPRAGQGSKGGRVTSMKFNNGAILRFMTAGGGDKMRAGYTAPVVCMTETDGFDTRDSTSDEADKISQIEARMRATPFGQRRIYKECTVTTAEGHTWRRYQAGTATEIRMPCSHCHRWVKLERENFAGWQDAKTDAEALDNAGFFCSECGEQWTEADRVDANRHAKLVHKGQSITEDGVVSGERPYTHTLGFRWSGVNNLLVPASNLGLDEWTASRAIDEDNEERKMSQFVWCVPYEPLDAETVELSVDVLKKRTTSSGRGQIPDDTRFITLGIDVNKTVLHWSAIAWLPADKGHVVDYGTTGVKPDHFPGIEAAMSAALAHLKGKIGTGWTSPNWDRAYVDCRWCTPELVRAVRSLHDRRFVPFMGLGLGHWGRRSFTSPPRHQKSHAWIGSNAYEKVVETHGCIVAYADANYWKTWLHNRLNIKYDSEQREVGDGGITLFDSMNENEHTNFAKHLTAEKEQQLFEQGKGYVRVWEAIRRQNHWLDSTYMACVAGHRLGVGLQRRPTVVLPSTPTCTSDERQYFGSDDGFTAPTFN